MTVATNRTIRTFADNQYDIPEVLDIVEDNMDKIFDNEVMLAEHIVGTEIPEEVFGRVISSIGIIRVMTKEDGDKRIVWCRRISSQVRAAKKMFLDLIKQGMVPYVVGVNGKATSKEMKEFDPLAEEVIFMPMRAISGG